MTVGLPMEECVLQLLNRLHVYNPSIGYQRKRMIEYARWFLSIGWYHALVLEHEKRMLLSILRCFIQLEDEYSARQRKAKAQTRLKQKQKATSQDGLLPELPVALDQEYNTKRVPSIHEQSTLKDSFPPELPDALDREYNRKRKPSIPKQATLQDHFPPVLPVALDREYNSKRKPLIPVQAFTWPDDLCGKGSYELSTDISSNVGNLSIFPTDAAAAALMALSQHNEFSSGSTIHKKECNSNYQN